MITANLNIGKNVTIDKSAIFNNVTLGDDTKIAARVTIFGAEEHPLLLGKGCYIGPNCLIEGYNAPVVIGDHVSFAQNINLMSGSGPNASTSMQRVFPIKKGSVHVGDHTWIGASVVIMPGVTIGKYCVVAANSFVNQSFDDYSIIGGTPAKLIRIMDVNEIELLGQ